jgi:hypothetical protein
MMLLPKNLPVTESGSLATVLAHLCIITDVAKPEAIEAFGSAYDEARDILSGGRVNAALLN